MTQQVKDPVLSLQWLRLLLWGKFVLGLGQNKQINKYCNSNDLPSLKGTPYVFTVGGQLFCCLFRAASVAYGGSQAWGQIRTVAAGLHHSHSNARSEPHLRPTPQLKAMPNP